MFDVCELVFFGHAVHNPIGWEGLLRKEREIITHVHWILLGDAVVRRTRTLTMCVQYAQLSSYASAMAASCCHLRDDSNRM